ncbi:MAG: hypothetical protein JJT85_05790 [Chromatiales bacterium]|nr:hypothetical protein [Chromatiales bacterium]
MLNRSAFIVRYKQPFVDWINEADPSPGDTVTLGNANEDTSVYLTEYEDEADFREWLKLNHESIFEELLNDWYTDPDLWPEDRSMKMMDKWFSFEFHSVVLDTGDSPIEDDEIEA